MPFEKNKKGWLKGTIASGYTYLTSEKKKTYYSDTAREPQQYTLTVTVKHKAPPKTVKNKGASKFPEAGLSSSKKWGWKPVNKPFWPKLSCQRKLESQKKFAIKTKSWK